MNKKTIQQMLDRRRLLMRRLRATVNELSKLDDTIEKARTGKIKVPPPPGKKVLFNTMPKDMRADFDDVVPSFGSSAVGGTRGTVR
jgi:hypothetical protein